MSGSNRKKERREFNNEVLGERKRQEAANAQKEQQMAGIYKVVAIVVAVAVVALLLWNNNPFQKQPVAATINGQDYTLPELAYYYNSARQYEAMMASYFGGNYSPSLPDSTQIRVAAVEAGVDENGNQVEAAPAQTYAEYFRESAVSSLESTSIWYQAAVDAGQATVTADMKAKIDDNLRQISITCSQYSISQKSYFQQVYGAGMTQKLFVSLLEKGYVAEAYATAFQAAQEISDDEITSYYNENKNTYDLTTYNIFYVDGAPEEKLDSDGNKIDPTEAEISAALRSAKTTADEITAAVKDGTGFHAATVNHDENLEALLDESYYFKPNMTYSGTNASVAEWIYDASRKLGDVATIASVNSTGDTIGYYVVEFLARMRDDELTASIRHILIHAETTEYVVAEDGTETVFDPASVAEGEEKPATVTKPSEEQWAAAQAEIDRIQQEWLDADGSEETFAELANKYSTDTGSNTIGGLYEGNKPGGFVPNFDAWVFDPARAPGDHGTVQNDGSYVGCHLIYYVSQGQPQWMNSIRDTLKADASQAWYEAQHEQISSVSYPDVLAALGA